MDLKTLKLRSLNSIEIKTVNGGYGGGMYQTQGRDISAGYALGVKRAAHAIGDFISGFLEELAN